MIRRIRDLLYDQGFTISGARNKMQEILQLERDQKNGFGIPLAALEITEPDAMESNTMSEAQLLINLDGSSDSLVFIRQQLFEIRALLSP